MLDLTRGDTPERSSDLLFSEGESGRMLVHFSPEIWSDRGQVAPIYFFKPILRGMASDLDEQDMIV